MGCFAKHEFGKSIFKKKSTPKECWAASKKMAEQKKTQKIRDEWALGSSNILRWQMQEGGGKCQNGSDKFSSHCESNKKVTR